MTGDAMTQSVEEELDRPDGVVDQPDSLRPAAGDEAAVVKRSRPGAGSGFTVMIGRRFYAAGLDWRSEEDASGLVALAKQQAANPDVRADYFLTVPHNSRSQYALGYRRHGHLPGQRSLALAVMDGLGPTFLAVVRLDEGRWWFGHAINGEIIPECDQVLSGPQAETEARALYRRELGALMSATGDGAVKVSIVVPNSWGVQGAVESEIEDLVDPTVKVASLRPMKGIIGWLEALSANTTTAAQANKARLGPMVGVALVMCVVGVGIWGFMQYQHSQVLATKREADRKKLAAEMQARKMEAESRPKTAWSASPLPSAWIRECRFSMGAIFVQVPGWVLDTARCENGVAQVSWTNDGSGMIMAVEQLAVSQSLAPPFIDTGKVTLSKPFDMDRLKSMGVQGDVAAVDLYRMKQIFSDSLVQMNIVPGFEAPPSTAQPPAAAAAAGAVAAVIPSKPPMTWTFTTKLPGFEFGPLLNNVPALEVKMLQLNVGSGQWALGGIVHLK